METVTVDPKKLKAEKAAKGMAVGPRCTRCEHPMILRKRKVTNTEFWGCSMFPTCKNTLSLDAGKKQVMTEDADALAAIQQANGRVAPEKKAAEDTEFERQALERFKKSEW
jgi:ssDNA-binding Zn-finger/Zn-ribbon topoisomerase 1